MAQIVVDAPPPPKYKFSEGERVLCFHGPLIYEAKALRVTVTKDKQVKYYIHYAGWSKNWDEWVPENRVLKYNDVNVQRQKEVFKQHSTTAKGKKGKASKKSESSSTETTSETSTQSATSNATSNVTSTGGRGHRGSKASRPITPVIKDKDKDNTDITSHKRDSNAIEGNKDDAGHDKDVAETPVKKKRGGSSTSDKSATNTARSVTPIPPSSLSVTAGGASNSSNASTATTATAMTSSSTATSSSTTVTTSRIDACVESEEAFLTKIEVRIKIPDELKQCLTDDWDAVTRQHKLVEVPAKVSVQDIIDQYLAMKKAAKSTNASKEVAINDVLDGILEYFNVMIGSQLLYKFERPQYVEIMQKHPDTPPSQLYGSFHLLRLFVNLGKMLSYSSLDEKAMALLLGHLHDFLKFLVKNSATYFSMSNFVNVDPEYVRHAQ